MFKVIVCAVDDSPESRLATETACAIVSSSGASLYLITVVSDSVPSRETMEDIASYERADHVHESPWHVAQEILNAGGKQIIDATRQRAQVLGVTVDRAVIRSGKPAKEITRFAGEVGADCIVLGSHHRGFFSLAGVPHHVVSDSRLNVITVTAASS
jgi:nucleotide-binding universal stress UspA family protein